MEITKCKSNLGSIKLNTVFIELLLLWQMLKEFTSLYKLHDEVNSCLIGKHMIHRYDKRMVDLQQYQFLNF